MPIYQYRCRECGEDLEIQQSFHDDPLTTCPSCEGSLRKVFSAVGISFKGSGFYKTDTRAASGSSSSGGSASASSSSDSSDSTSSSSSSTDGGSSTSGSESSSSSEGSSSSSSDTKAASTSA